MTKKILIAYFTKSVASEEYANVIAETLKIKGFVVNICNLAHEVPDVASFDSVVLGTGVRMSMVYRRWSKILKQKALKEKNLFIFLSSGTAIKEPEKAVERFLQPLMDKYCLKPMSLVSFPGKIPEKWAILDGKKENIKPEKAKVWVNDIISQKIK